MACVVNLPIHYWRIEPMSIFQHRADSLFIILKCHENCKSQSGKISIAQSIQLMIFWSEFLSEISLTFRRSWGDTWIKHNSKICPINLHFLLWRKKQFVRRFPEISTFNKIQGRKLSFIHSNIAPKQCKNIIFYLKSFQTNAPYQWCEDYCKVFFSFEEYLPILLVQS